MSNCLPKINDQDCRWFPSPYYKTSLGPINIHVKRQIASKYFQVVQEYERAVIFRLGRLLAGGSRGPGITFPTFFH